MVKKTLRAITNRLAMATTMAVVIVIISTPAFAQQSNFDAELAAQILIMILVLGVFYIIPTMVAFYRKHPNRWLIFVINLVFGGTGIGWLGSLVWAFSAAHLSTNNSDGGESGLNLFVKDPKTVVVKSDEPERAFPPEPSNKITGEDVSAANTDVIAQLEKLKALHTSGAIDEQEFTALKKTLIG